MCVGVERLRRVRRVRQSDGFEERARRRVHYDNGGIRFDRARYVHDYYMYSIRI